MSQYRKGVRLLFWLKADGDIYRVHNSYNFMMVQIWQKKQYKLSKVGFFA